jgi:ferrous iron transport protein A
MVYFHILILRVSIYRWFSKPRPHGPRSYAQGAHGWAMAGHRSTMDVSLADLQANERGVVAALAGGRSLLQRLASMGFTPGASVEVIQNYGWGPLIVMARGARVALGRGEARLVAVERDSP